jgi:predicted ATPase/DNA-binding SARP family transcriptional activator/DNA-binding XRE family transcriptional regulator
MDDWVQFGREVCGARHRMGLRQEQLAARCGLSVRTVRDIERGRTRSGHRSARRVAESLSLPEPSSGAPSPGTGTPVIGVLGPLMLRVGAADHRLGSTMQRIVLGLLLVRPGEPVGRDQLVDVLWGSHPPLSCLNLVQTYVARLRRALVPLGLPAIETVPGGYRLRLPAEHDAGLLDVLAFSDAAAAARRAHDAGDDSTAMTLYGTALDLWRGPVLVDLGDRVREHPSVIALHRERLATTVEYAALAETRARPEVAVTRLLVVTRDEPLHEVLHAQLMLLLAASGQQADALAVYNGVRARLVEDLGVEPGPELRAAHRRILRQELPVSTRRPAAQPVRPQWRGPHGHLPYLVGRDCDAAHLAGLLRTHRLVTVTGPAGGGKSALALSVAERRGGDVLVLNLAALSTSDDPMTALGHLLGTTGVTAISNALTGGGSLLVVDNAEHLVPAVAALVEQLLGSCPELTVLVTSRQSLGVSEETTWQLGPLPVPVADEPSPATELFCLRARQALSTVDLSGVAAIAGVVRRLDGLPLALELVAAQVRAVPVSQLLDRLDLALGLRPAPTDRSRAGDRRRSLRAAIDRSYVLLSRVEQRVLAELSVFRGAFGVEAAESVSDQGEAVLPVLVSLVDRSLLTAVDRGGVSRFRLLETMREYAAARLAESAAAARVHQRHIAYWLDSSGLTRA